MVFALLKYGLGLGKFERQFPRAKPLKPSYDVVIIGGGGHGAATAYYLARDYGITDVAILEKGYLGGGNTARNTTIIRSNYLTPEGVKFYDESLTLWKDLANDFDINIMYSERGHFTLAHTDAAIRTSRWRAEVNKHLGVNSELVVPRRDRPPLPGAQPLRGRALSDPRRALPSAGRHRPPRRGRLGLCARRDAARRRIAPADRGHRDRSRERQRRSAWRRRAAASRPAR